MSKCAIEHETSFNAPGVSLSIVRRIVLLLAVLGLTATACGSTAQIIEVAAESDVEVARTTTTAAAPEALRSGREAILANHSEGKPYVLWYWGAH
ncbi:MAG: hypothetical protein ACI81L_001548 [Verrucomicrobiales bacterium]